MHSPGTEEANTRPGVSCTGRAWLAAGWAAGCCPPCPAAEGVGVSDGVGGEEESEGLEEPPPRYSSRPRPSCKGGEEVSRGKRLGGECV